MHLDQEKEMDTQGAVKAFLTHAKARGLSHNTVQAYRWALNHITCDNLPDEPEAIESILAHAAPRLAQESLHDLWRVLRTFFRWARLRFEMPDPTAQVTPPRCAVAFCPRPSLQRRFVGFSIKDAVPAATAFWC